MCIFVSLMTSSDSVAVLKWVGESSYGDKMSSIKMMRKAEPLQFFLRQPTAHSITEMFAEGNYTSLMANFRMVRRLTGSIMNTYAPSTMIVTMSWVSFWIKVDAVPRKGSAECYFTTHTVHTEGTTAYLEETTCHIEEVEGSFNGCARKLFSSRN
ncbi:hypothetical protein CEXT_726161 [Caerostris extrusa]|uniref:Uncharacterized protein n=1 Tax=Caerostris extrusa TaxID=172846 RepID=A0AAV4WUY2_CAEEX|nr:hypothetical protein CEXT_726161 [Caerostris extrusa]